MSALLHDYFYMIGIFHLLIIDVMLFHIPEELMKMLFRDFELNELERDIILKHMFPLTLKLPRYRESYIVLLADKYCAVYETLAKTRTQSKVALLEESLIKRHHMHL